MPNALKKRQIWAIWHEKRQYGNPDAMITLLLLVCATYVYGVVLHAHPVRGQSHNQRNTTGEVATPQSKSFNF